MFPIRDHNPSTRTPWVVFALIGANVLVYLLSLWLTADPRAEAEFYMKWALFPVAVTENGEYRGLVTSLFLHAGFFHIAGNMLFLWIFGDNLEEQMGHFGFLLFYLASGVLAGLAQVATEPQSAVPTVGASGAIAGVMGAYLLFFPKARVDVLLFIVIYARIFTVPAVIVLGLWLVFQFFGGFAALSATGPSEGGVAYWAHIGGFIAGLVMAAPLWLKRGGPGFWARTAGHPPHAAGVYAPSIIPAVRRRR